MNNFYDTVVEVLRQDTRFFTDEGELLRNAVCEAAMQMDAKLIKYLLKNPITKERFFTDVDGIAVFDTIDFGWVVNNRQFLPDSYTRYKNKIGLVDGNGDFIATSNNVELVFPYKDCVLEGGQTKDDQKRDEIFYNETLAPDEVDRLLYPKVFTNAKRYTKDGEETATDFLESDNLIIKGNNLLAISSLLKRYEGKIKCIYIDVPYNTGNDSFGYNDRFNHSTWLCFIKNRLELAYNLLCKEGTIAISVDNYELAYIMVLLDEIFEKDNRKNVITIKRGSVTGAKVINPGVVNVVEYVVVYSKNSDYWKPNRVYSSKGYDDRYGNYILDYDKGFRQWKFTTVLEAFAAKHNVKKSKLKSLFGTDYEKSLESFVLENSEKVCQFATLDDSNISQEARTFKLLSLETPNEVMFLDRGEEKPYYVRNGKLILFAKDRLLEIDGRLTFSQPITDIWEDVLPNDLHNEGGVELKKGKKPEKLISRVLELCTNENDIVLDFFAGSGTTGAAALKMNRRFILCEQMEYIDTTTKQRIINTINGETRGISKAVNWQGGGSFVYCELAKLNQNYVEHIQSAKNDAELSQVWAKMKDTGFISSLVDIKAIDPNAPDFQSLSFADKKILFIALLDKNQLYINYCDIDDQEFVVSEDDKAFTNSFYKGV
ncbi:MAG: site-specific DNA-methyltransferase [Oscillospiraceae bacterium]